MENKTTALVGTSPEVLQHYLTAGIEIQAQYSHDEEPWRAKLLGVGLNYNSEGCKVADDLGGGRIIYPVVPYYKCLPVLRSFASLCEPLPDGAVPAALLFALHIGQISENQIADFQAIKFVKDHYHGESIMLRKASGFEIYLRKSLFDTGNYDLRTLKWLWQNGFAVGLEPSQYIEKEVGGAPTKEGRASHE